MICVLPPYKDEQITEPVECNLVVMSGGKKSEPQSLTYEPLNGPGKVSWCFKHRIWIIRLAINL